MIDIDKTIEEVKAEMLPFESWEKLAGETSMAFAAFCAFRDLGAGRNIRKAVEETEEDVGKRYKRYRVWRNWSTQFKWRERAADYDRYIEQLKQTEVRKNIEARGEKHREVTGKMLDVVIKKLDSINPADLGQNVLTEWVQTAIKVDNEAASLITPNGKTEPKQGELNFVADFNGV
jgi:hypothetical protein